MARTYSQLDLGERRTLFRLVEARRPVGEIAERLGRHRSTIYRELGRNRFRDGDRGFCGYFPLTAQDLASRRRQRCRKLAADDGLRAHVVERLAAGWSPQQIAGRLKRQTADPPSATRRSTGTSMGRRAARAASTVTCRKLADGAGPATAASPGPPRSRASAGSRTDRPRSSGARVSVTGRATC